jgi:hypothetical protein
MALPPLLDERPPSHQKLIPIVGPILGGVITGIALGISEPVWLVVNLVMILGGIAAGFDHLGAAEGAKRGLLGGFLFGCAVVLTDAVTGWDRAAKLPDPAILLVVVTTVVSIGLGAAGGALRARAQARAVASEPVASEPAASEPVL